MLKFNGKKTGIDFSGNRAEKYDLGCEVEAMAFSLAKVTMQPPQTTPSNGRGASTGNALVVQPGDSDKTPANACGGAS